MNYNYDELIEELKSLGEFLFVHNVGNAGDSLIYYGMIELFRQHGIKYLEYSDENYRSCKNLVYGGGGGFVRYYDHCSKFIEKHIDTLEKFILLPQTVSGHEELLMRMDERFVLFLREKTSFDYCNRINQNCKTYLSHDLAFSLVGIKLNYKLKWNFPVDSVLRRLKWIIKLLIVKLYSLFGFIYLKRRDIESAIDSNRNIINIDLSDFLSSGDETHEQRMMTAEVFLKLISGFRKIKTDRLHIGIAAYIMGRKCYLMEGSYYKMTAVYKRSMEGTDTTVTI